jgi:hypothetical protein
MSLGKNYSKRGWGMVQVVDRAKHEAKYRESERERERE